MDIWLSCTDQKNSSSTATCVYLIWPIRPTMKTQKRQYQQSPLHCPPPPLPLGAKWREDELHLTVSVPCFLFPFPVRQIRLRPMAHFCRTKQPTKENSWILASLIFLLLKNIPKKLFLNPRSNISLPKTAWLGSLGKWYRSLMDSALFMFLPCLSLFPAHG